MSEKLCHIEFNSDTAKHDVRINNITVNSWVEENEAFISCKLINTAADAWKARETEDLRQEIAEQKDYIEQLLKEIKLQRESSKHPF